MENVKQKKRYNFAKIIGNILIILSIVGFLFIFAPLLQLYTTPSVDIKKTPAKGLFITIPKINAYAPIITNVDPFNEGEYNEALQKGVAHAKNTAIPGEDGTSFLFAHSSGAPWDITRTNTLFLRLPELTINDTIIVTKDGNQEKFVVVDKKEVWPTEVTYLNPSSKNQLILQTCTPIGTSLKRLLVFAERK